MKKNISILLEIIILCVALSACNSKNIKENNKNKGANELVKETATDESGEGEVVQYKEDMPVMSDESIQCIEAALGEYSKRGEGIAEFLSDISIGKIVRAEMIEGERFGDTTLLEVEDDLGDVFVVVLTPDYFPQVIVKDSIDGEAIFGVEE